MPHSATAFGQPGDSPKRVSRLAGIERQTPWVLPAIFFLGLGAVFAAPLFSKSSWMIYVQDDLFYYLQIARNIVQGHGSTFNHVVLTNGYQPLWLVLLLPVCAFTQKGEFILGFIAVCGLLASIATFLLTRILVRSTGARPLLVFCVSSVVTLYSVTLFFYGMEVIITVPVMLAVLCVMRNEAWVRDSVARAFLLGLLLAALALSRIDTLIFCAFVLAGIVLSPSLRSLIRPRVVAGTVIGLCPLVFYFWLNHRLFGTWLPVSGMAKQLKIGHMPSLEPWRVFFHPLAAAYTALIASALVILTVVWRRFSPMERVLYSACLLFPFTYYFILSCVSDWTLWGWYMYPIRIAACISFIIFCVWPPSARVLQRDSVCAVLIILVFGALAHLRWTRQQTDIYDASVEIRQFELTHPGTYAMGDRAGRVGWMISSPVIQTEGLMMDRDYLHFVREQTPLRQVLAKYGVRYYIATAYEPFSGCFQASEPAKAGPDSAHMRASFCEPPIQTLSHEGIQTLIYDLKP